MAAQPVTVKGAGKGAAPGGPAPAVAQGPAALPAAPAQNAPAALAAAGAQGQAPPLVGAVAQGNAAAFLVDDDDQFLADPADVRFVVKDIKGDRAYAKWMSGKRRDDIFYKMFAREEGLLPTVWAEGAQKVKVVGKTYMEKRMTNVYPHMTVQMFAEAKITKEKVSDLFYWLNDCSSETCLPDDDYVKSEPKFEANMVARKHFKLPDNFPITAVDLKELANFVGIHGNVILGPNQQYNLNANQIMLSAPYKADPAGNPTATIPIPVNQMRNDTQLLLNNQPNVAVQSTLAGFNFKAITILKAAHPNTAAVQGMKDEPIQSFEPDGVSIPETMQYRFPTADEVKLKRKKVAESRAKDKAASAPVTPGAANAGNAKRLRRKTGAS
jgi:hypothetical protein